MTDDKDQTMADAMWWAADLKRAYLIQDRAAVKRSLTGLNAGVLDHVLAWTVLRYDELVEALGETSMPVRGIEAVTALAPPESEFAITTAVLRVASGKTGFLGAVKFLALRNQIHTMAICTVVTLVEAVGRVGAAKALHEDIAAFARAGWPRPSPIA